MHPYEATTGISDGLRSWVFVSDLSQVPTSLWMQFIQVYKGRQDGLECVPVSLTFYDSIILCGKG
jgi:hypothetical protein